MWCSHSISPHPADVISEQPLSGWTVVINLNYTFHHLFVVTFNIIFTMMMKIILLVHVRVWQEEALWRPNGELIYKPLERDASHINIIKNLQIQIYLLDSMENQHCEVRRSPDLRVESEAVKCPRQKVGLNRA